MELGARLKKARESKRLSQNEVSHLLGVSQKTILILKAKKVFLTYSIWPKWVKSTSWILWTFWQSMECF
jgi:transcriptional regulator with XRE-family HTH domain